MTLGVFFWVIAVWFFFLAASVALSDWWGRRAQRRWFEREMERLDRWRGSA